jgi:hypothetical protein
MFRSRGRIFRSLRQSPSTQSERASCIVKASGRAAVRARWSDPSLELGKEVFAPDQRKLAGFGDEEIQARETARPARAGGGDQAAEIVFA